MKKIILIILLAVIIIYLAYFFYSYYQKDNYFNQLLYKTNKENIFNKRAEPSLSNSLLNQSDQNLSPNLSLEIEAPQDKAVVKSNTILIKGKTAPLADVFINEKETKSDSQGNFSFNYSLDEGENELIIAANDNNGNYAEKVLTVELKTPN